MDTHEDRPRRRLGDEETCTECGAGFLLSSPRQRRCSQQCRTASRRALERTRRRRDPSNRILSAAKGRAAKKGIDFDLTLEDIYVPEFCPVLGVRLVTGKGVHGHASPSLDRIDPTKGYTPDNVWVISYRANQIKSDATPEEIARIYTGLLERGYL